MHKTLLLLLLLMIGAFSSSHAFVRSTPRLISFFHRQSSLSYTYQRYNYYDIDTISSHNIGRIRSRTLHLSSPFSDQHHTFGKTTDATTAATTTPTPTTTSTSENDQVRQPFSWPRLIELFRKSTAVNTTNGTLENTNYISSDHPNLALFRRSVPAQKLYEEHKQYLDKYWKTPYDYMVIRKFGQDFGFTKVVADRHGSLNDNRRCENNGYIMTDQTTDDESTTTTMHSIFQASTSLTQASKYAIEHQTTYLSLVLNEFPYDVKEGIEHWCLWKIGGTSISEGIVHDELVWAMHELAYLLPDESSGSWCIYQRGDDNDDGASATATIKSSLLLDKTNVSYARQMGKSSRPRTIADSFYWVNPPHLQSMPEIHHAHILVLRSDESRDDADCTTCSPPV